jgi:hypothetical protein
MFVFILNNKLKFIIIILLNLFVLKLHNKLNVSQDHIQLLIFSINFITSYSYFSWIFLKI